VYLVGFTIEIRYCVAARSYKRQISILTPSCGLLQNGDSSEMGHCAIGLKDVTIHRYEAGPKNNRNLNVARELETVARCAARCRESTQYSSSLPSGVSLG
jgi:hypothetical protein